MSNKKGINELLNNINKDKKGFLNSAHMALDFVTKGIKKKSSEFIENIHIEAEEKYLITNEYENIETNGDDTEENYNDEKTKSMVIEKPGFVMKKSEAEDSDLEGAPTIISADTICDAERDYSPDEFDNQLRREADSGQIMFDDFEKKTQEKVEHISEEEAEKELFKRRKARMDKFVLDEDKDSNALGNENSEKIGELFEMSRERPRKKDSENFDGVEYTKPEDEHRVLRYFRMQKKKSSTRLTLLGVLLGLTLIIAVASSVHTTVGGDKILTIFLNFVMISLSLVVSNQTIVDSFEQIKKKKITLNTAISATAILCFFQNLLMLVLYFLDKDTVSVFSGMGVLILFWAELNKYIVTCRTIDTMELCTGKNADRLFSIEGITDDKDTVELAKNVKNSSPRIRYSSKIRFPSHLIELCMSDTAADKISKTLMIAGAIFGLINMIITWILHDFPTGFAAFTVTVSLCIPSYGALLYQLPLRWINKNFNRDGGMISCQGAVEELCRTNVIMLDSADLFDRDACTMKGFKDFKNVRIDDSMLYAAALVIRSGGPLVGVFDDMIKSKRDLLPTVKSFSYEERLGMSGWINEQKVILGTRAMMLTHDVQIPETVDEQKYLISGYEVLYLAIAHKPAAMIVVEYKPNERIAPLLKTMRDSGVKILAYNTDPNVTEEMISSCYDMRLNNIKILNTSSGRVYKKYKLRPKMAARAFSIHDGTPYSFMKSLSISAHLRRIFKISDVLMIIGVLMGFVIMLVLSLLKVVCDLPAIFTIAIQIIIAIGFFGIIKIMQRN